MAAQIAITPAARIPQFTTQHSPSERSYQRAGISFSEPKRDDKHRYNRDQVPPLSQAADDLKTGRMALEAGAWLEAQQAFERLLKVEETPEALEGLGLAAWWLDLAEEVFDSRERAYRA